MNSPDQINQLTKRPIQYWFSDGIGELVTGVVFLISGGFFVLQQALTSPALIILSSIAGVLIIGGGTFLGRAVIGNLKERVVYPRTGYVAYGKQLGKRKRSFALGIAVLVVLIILILGNTTSTLNWLPIIIGTVCGALMLYQSVQSGLLRLYLEAAAAPLVGVIMAISGMPASTSSGFFFLIYGGVLALGGGGALWQYRQHAPAAEAPHE